MKLQFWQRWLCTPYMAVEYFIPKNGRIVDLGCGWGLFAYLLVLTGKERTVFGLDISLNRIICADRVSNADNPKFCLGTLEAIKKESVDTIVVYDVLHHLSYSQQTEYLAQAWQCLSKDGVIVIKENDTVPRWKYAINYLIEFIAIKTGYTLSKPLSFRGRKEWKQVLENSGFAVSALPLKTWHPWPHILFIGNKCQRSF